jgi:capsular exopolysaccharide synthesis family protein
MPNFLDPVSLLMALRRRWLRTLLIGLVCAAAAAGITWKVWPPDAWIMHASIQVNPFQQSILGQTAPKTPAEVASFKQTQESLMVSWIVCYNAINQPQVRELPLIKDLVARNEDPVTWLVTHLSASFTAPEILTVNLTGDDPDQLRPILNAVVSAYLDGVVHKDDNGYQTKLSKLKELYDEYYQEAQDRKAVYVNVARALGAHGTPATDIMQKYALERTFRAETKLVDLSFDLLRLRMVLRNEEAKLKALAQYPISDTDVEQWIEQDLEVQDLRAKIGEQQKAMDDLLLVVARGKDNPLYKREVEVLDELKKRLGRRRRMLRPLGEDELRDSLTRQQSNKIFELEEQIRNAKEEEKAMREVVEQSKQKAEKVNLDTMDLDKVQGEINEIQGFLAHISGQMQTLKVELKAAPKIRALGDAWASPPGIGRKQIMATWASGLGAFALVLFGFSWREFRARKINTLDEIVHGLGLRVVGTLPALPDRKSRGDEPYGVSQGEFWPSHLIESVDTTRTMLLHAARVESVRSVMIASAQSGEGKTSLAIQLAASLARAGRKTLYIDGDLRNPAAHQVFNLELQPGLSELLRGEVQIPEAIQPTSVRGLWVIPAGLWDAHATEALAQEAARPLLNRLKNEFDFIILDSSPALPVVDGLLLGQQVDAAIFSIMHGISHSPSVYAAHQRFEALNIRILGAVVNGVAPARGDYQLGYTREEPETAEHADVAESDEELDIE